MGDVGAIRFAEKMLTLLDDGLYTATYKYAVLLGLLDLALKGVDQHGDPPQMVTTRQLAEKVIEIYWRHAVPFGRGSSADVLRQNAGRPTAQAEIVRRIQEFRIQMAAEHATGSLVQLRSRAPSAFARLCDDVEWKLIQMPLPRVQMVGNVHDEFIYSIGWTTDIRRREVQAYQRGTPSDFDSRILLKPGVGAYLIQLNGLLRPLIHRRWTGMVARLNRMEESQLETFLFGPVRSPLSAIGRALIDLQKGECFYCRGRLSDAVDIDHFLPWSRYPEDGLANLVAAHSRCNHAKRDFLAATPHVVSWAERLDRPELIEIELSVKWEARVEDVRGVARGIYLRLPEDAILWLAGREFETPDMPVLQHILA